MPGDSGRAFARDTEIDRQSGLPDDCASASDARQSRLRRESGRGLVPVAQETEQPTHLAERLSARVLDLGQCGSGLLIFPVRGRGARRRPGRP